YEARRILNLMVMSGRIPLRMGSDTAMPDPQTPRSSPASRFIVERALAKDPRPLHILAVGALTNVASAYLENKKIRDRIRIIWLGGSRWPEGALSEFNAVNDRAAVKCIIEADRKSTRLNSSHDQISYAVFCLKKKIIPLDLHILAIEFAWT